MTLEPIIKETLQMNDESMLWHFSRYLVEPREVETIAVDEEREVTASRVVIRLMG